MIIALNRPWWKHGKSDTRKNLIWAMAHSIRFSHAKTNPMIMIGKVNKMLNYNTTRLEESCRKLMATLGKKITWKWDKRFETVLAEFSVADKEIIYQAIAPHMGKIWDTDTIGDIPSVVQMVMDYFGGMNPGQRLLTSDVDVDGLLLCAWWPWGNNTTISIRIGVFADSLNDEENEELTEHFRSWFDI